MTVTLGAHTQALTPAAKAGIARGLPAVLKIVGTPCLDVGLLTDWRRARPAGTLIYREPFPDEDLTEPDARTNQLLGNAERIRHLGPLLETPWNEVAGQGGALLDLYSAVTVQAVRRIAAAGYRAVIGNFAEGNPGDLSQWPRFFQALRVAREHGGFLGLHEYSSPTMQSGAGWHCLRFEKVYELLPTDCRLLLIITECGLDWTGRAPTVAEWGDRGFGWRAHQVEVTDYVAQIRWYMEECRRIVASGLVPSVQVTIFGYGTFSDWDSFDTAGEPEIEAVMQEYGVVDSIAPVIEERPVSPTQTRYEEWAAARTAAGEDPRDQAAFAAYIASTGGNPLTLEVYGWQPYRIGPGIKDAMAALGDVPLSDEVWIGHLGSYAKGRKNQYHWNPDRGLFVSFPTVR